MTLEKYFAEVERAVKDNPQWRYGQAAFNVLHAHRPDLSEQIRGTRLDPFPDRDGLQPEFYGWLRANWVPGDCCVI